MYRLGDGDAGTAAAADDDDVVLSLVRNRMVMIKMMDGAVVDIAMKKREVYPEREAQRVVCRRRSK